MCLPLGLFKDSTTMKRALNNAQVLTAGEAAGALAQAAGASLGVEVISTPAKAIAATGQEADAARAADKERIRRETLRLYEVTTVTSDIKYGTFCLLLNAKFAPSTCCSVLGLQQIVFNIVLHYITLHYITLHYITLHLFNGQACAHNHAS
jgi:hypothetical protein